MTSLALVPHEDDAQGGGGGTTRVEESLVKNTLAEAVYIYINAHIISWTVSPTVVDVKRLAAGGRITACYANQQVSIINVVIIKCSSIGDVVLL